MFFFENYTWQNILVALAVLVALVVLNEITRRSKWAALVMYLILPIALTIFVWPQTAVRGSGDWFPIVKTLSALAGVLGFMVIRYTKAGNNKWVLLFPFVILAVNIAEAVYRDIEVFMNYAGKPGVFNQIDGLYMQGGPWNIMNAIAGIFPILTWFCSRTISEIGNMRERFSRSNSTEVIKKVFLRRRCFSSSRSDLILYSVSRMIPRMTTSSK